MESLDDPGHLRSEHLLEILDGPEAPGLEAERQHLERCVACQAWMEQLWRIEAALSWPAWIEAVQRLDLERPPAMPEAVIERLRAIGDAGGTQRQPETRDGVPETRGGVFETRDGVPETRDGVTETRDRMPETRGGVPEARAGSSFWRLRAPIALAATVLLVVGIWSLARRAEEAPTRQREDMLWKGSPTAGPRVMVVVLEAGAAETQALSPVPVDGGRYEVRVPRTSSIQLRIGQREPARSLRVSVSCARPGSGVVYLSPEGVSPLIASLEPGQTSVALGRPLRIDALDLKPGERIECQVSDGIDTMGLNIETGP